MEARGFNNIITLKLTTVEALHLIVLLKSHSFTAQGVEDLNRAIGEASIPTNNLADRSHADQPVARGERVETANFRGDKSG